LDSKLERPGERPIADMRHPRLFQWALAHRGHLIWAACTLVQHWVAEGRPRPKDVPSMGGFESWVETLGGILEAAQIEGLLANREYLYTQVDEGLDAWRALILGWWKRYGSDEVSTQQLMKLIEELGIDWDWGQSTDERGRRSSLGQALGGARLGMVAWDLQLRRSDKRVHNAWMWHLAAVGPHTPER
jgi:hypothetical protein